MNNLPKISIPPDPKRLKFEEIKRRHEERKNLEFHAQSPRTIDDLYELMQDNLEIQLLILEELRRQKR